MGIGKGSLITAQKVFLKKKAKPDEVSLYFAFSFSTSHAGTFLAFLLSPLVDAVSTMYVRVCAMTCEIGGGSCTWLNGCIDEEATHFSVDLILRVLRLFSPPPNRGFQAALWTSTAVCVLSALCAFPLLGTL